MPIGTNAGRGPVSRWSVEDMLRPSISGAEIAAPRPDPAVALNTAGIAKGTKGNIFDRLQAEINKPGMRAALLRSGAATLEGGLGKGIATGAAFMDDRRAAGESARRYDMESALRERGVDINQQSANQQGEQIDNQWELGKLAAGTNIEELGERRRSNQARERLDARGQDVTVRGQDVGLTSAREARAVDMRGQDVGLQNGREGRAVQRYGIDVDRDTAVRGQDVSLANNRESIAAGIGSKAASNGYNSVVKKTPGSPAQTHWFSPDEPGVPATIETTRTPIGVQPPLLMAPAPGAPGGPPSTAVAALKANPGLAAEFDAKFGPGSSSQYLGGR